MDNIGNSGWLLLNLSTLKYMVQNTVLSAVQSFLRGAAYSHLNQQTPTLAAQNSSIIKTNRREVIHGIT